MKKLLTVLLAVVACGALIATRERPQKYTFAEVQVRTITERIEAVGVVQPERVYALTPSVAGRVRRVFVEEGERVLAGQAICEMEALPQNAGSVVENMENAQADAAALQREALRACTVYAPADGVVTALAAYPDMAALPTTPLGSLSAEGLEVLAQVPESVREDLFAGQSVVIARGEAQYKGVISSITPSQDVSAQYLLTIEPDGKWKELEVGMRVDVRIELASSTGAAVPLQAIGPDGTVKCRTEGGVVAVPVVTGQCSEFYAQLLQGPPVGTEVVISSEGE